MMSIAEIVQGKKWKQFMARMYGWGASVVIVGALFKIMHFPGAGPMLVVGLGTEAVIFFFSAFEPVHEDLDWTLVYPELKHGHDDKGTVTQQLDDMLKEHNVGPELIGSLGSGLSAFSNTVSKLTDISTAAIATDEYSKNVSQASQSVGKLNEKYEKSEKVFGEFVDVSANAKNRLAGVSESSEQLSGNLKSTATSLSGLNEKYAQGKEAFGSLLESSNAASGNLASVAGSSEKYNQNLQSASEKLSSLSQSYEKGNTSFNSLAENTSKAAGQMAEVAQFSGEYSGSVKTAAGSLNEINASYVKAVEAMNELAKTTGTTKSYGDQVTKMTKNLESLNALYELDLQDSNKKLVTVINELSETTNATKLYGQNIQQLSQQINSLNTLYLEEVEQSRQRTGAVRKYYDSLEDILSDLSASAEGTKRYKSEIQTLGQNLAALNTIYGNMLSAMSYAPGQRQ